MMSHPYLRFRSLNLRVPGCLVFGWLCFPVLAAIGQARAPGELSWAIRSDPRTLDSAQVDDQSSELLRYLTGGVLLRINRQTQQPEPSLAASWSISSDGKIVLFRLRSDLHFSDGSSLTAKDVAWSLRRVLLPATAAPVAAEFLAPAGVHVDILDPATVRVSLSKRVVEIASVFDEIAIEPAGRASDGKVSAGPFMLGDHKPGQYIHLVRNPHYWRHDSSGGALPYAAGIRLDIVSNREQEVLRFSRGEYDLIDNLPGEYFPILANRITGSARDLGPSLNTEQMWFNLAPSAPLPAYEKDWFQNTAFRLAVSQAIHRNDLVRIAYQGHATPAHGFISPANSLWTNKILRFPPENVAEAIQRLSSAGFRRSGAHLFDSSGHAVKFSLMTNAGNVARGHMATLIQADLAKLGIEVSIVTLDFPALIERMMHSQDYEACLLGLTNVNPDPNAMMNEWLSSSPNHQWNPSEKVPATPWEAEIDTEMLKQASSLRMEDRKRAVDRVQQIVADQQPFIYLVHPNALYAVSPLLEGVSPSVFQPGLVWNVDVLRRKASTK